MSNEPTTAELLEFVKMVAAFPITATKDERECQWWNARKAAQKLLGHKFVKLATNPGPPVTDLTAEQRKRLEWAAEQSQSCGGMVAEAIRAALAEIDATASENDALANINEQLVADRDRLRELATEAMAALEPFATVRHLDQSDNGRSLSEHVIVWSGKDCGPFVEDAHRAAAVLDRLKEIAGDT